VTTSSSILLRSITIAATVLTSPELIAMATKVERVHADEKWKLDPRSSILNSRYLPRPVVGVSLTLQVNAFRDCVVTAAGFEKRT
jgi:hypothetical protein